MGACYRRSTFRSYGPETTSLAIAPERQSSILYDAVPNPADGRASIPVKIADADEYLHPSLVITDITGKEIVRLQLFVGDNNLVIDTHNYKFGLYLYHFVLNGANHTVKKMSVVH